MNFYNQYKIFFKHGLLLEWSNKERLITPVLFGISLLLMFAFSMAGIIAESKYPIFIASSIITVLISMQIALSRTFEADRDDQIFKVLQTYPVNWSSWFFAKYTIILLSGLTIIIPLVFMASFFIGQIPIMATLLVLAVCTLCLFGLSALGILLTGITLSSTAKQILYPILYFPLTSPVLIGACQAAQEYMKNMQINANFWNWFALLAGFDIIYIALCFALFAELIDN